MRHEDINRGDLVVYIPKDLLVGDKDKMVKDENLGIVTSKNEKYIFVLYQEGVPRATEAKDLYSIRNRPDLIAKIKVKI